MGVEDGASIPDSNHSRHASHSLHSTSGQGGESVVLQAMIFRGRVGGGKVVALWVSDPARNGYLVIPTLLW